VQTIEVHVERDHLERLAVSKSPVASVAELIWNCLDADATVVHVRLERNSLGGIEGVTLDDNGHGLPHENGEAAFANLGGSWKRDSSRTLGGRILHGKQGKGRFQAFALGNSVTWTSHYQVGGAAAEYTIEGTRSQLHRFTITDPKASTLSGSGMVVRASGGNRSLSSLEGQRVRQLLTEEFALYLRQYAGVRIIYDGQSLDPSSVEDNVADYSIGPLALRSGRHIEAELTVVEWSVPTERALFLCDENGFTLSRVQAGIQAPGFVFTSYLKSALIGELGETGDLVLEELHPDLRELMDAAKKRMREHFSRRAAERATSLVDQWKQEEVYPYTGSPTGPIEEAERQVFDVIALNVHEYLPDFHVSSMENRRFSFRLLRAAIETSPEAVQSILRDVLNLSAAKQEELADLLERTSLEAIINASRIVTDRLDFLRGLEILVFDPEVKKKTLERRHLHKIVAQHTWLFGEEFNLTLSDKGLTNVLRKHLTRADVEILDDGPVLRENGSTGIVDLMLSRVVPHAGSDPNKHLVVELKRPTEKIGNTEASQVKDYATAIVRDERFRDTETSWEFWAVGNEMSESVRLEASQSGRQQGLLWELEDRRFRIWVKTWSQIIEGCRKRLQFFRQRLNYVADENSGLEYLRRTHEKYLPKCLTESPSAQIPPH